MKIKGLQNGMVMQRDENNLCDVYFESDAEIKSVSVSSKFSNPKAEKDGNRWHLTGIRVGGPYILTLNDDVFTDIYVGDVWLLTGQSNMQGIGRMVDTEHNDNSAIRAFYMDGHWDTANHPLHRPGEAIHKVHTKVLNATPENYNIKGVGPGLSFAKKMFDLTAVPQGVIACAHGGTNLYDQWDPKKLNLGSDESLYAATYDRFIMNGANCKGIFWYQGCSDSHEEVYKQYTDNMIELVNAFRKDFKADLPFVEVQIARCSWSDSDNPESMKAWTSIREQQRTLHEKIENFDTVHTVAYRLADCIHLCADAQRIVGKDAAEAMYCLIYGKLYGCVPGIKLRSMEVYQDEFDPNISSIILEYDNVHGKLCDNGRAMGFERAWNPDWGEHCGIFDVFCDGNRVTLRCDFPKEKIIGQYLWYGMGRDNCANITDEEGRSLPGFGPIKIKEGKI